MSLMEQDIRYHMNKHRNCEISNYFFGSTQDKILNVIKCWASFRLVMAIVNLSSRKMMTLIENQLWTKETEINEAI